MGKRRTIFFLEREKPETLGSFTVVDETENYTIRTVQPEHTQIGISISADELERCPDIGIPTLRRCLVTKKAFPSNQPEPGCQFIALLCLKDDVDRHLLHTRTLEQILELCLTWDGR